MCEKCEKITGVINGAIEDLNIIKNSCEDYINDVESETIDESKLKDLIFSKTCKMILFSISFIAMFLGSYYVMLAGIFGLLLHSWIEFFQDIDPSVQQLSYL